MKKLFSIATFACLSLALAAQDFRSGYFMDNYVYKYRLNPALTPDDSTKTVVGLGVGDITLAPTTTVGLSQFLFPTSDGLVLFMNENVKTEDFLKGLPDFTKIDLGVDLSILSLGFKTSDGYLTFDARLRGNVQGGLTKELFEYLKDGFEAKVGAEYNLSQLYVGTKDYLELALGYSKRVKGFKFGAALKLLAGIGQANIQVSDVNVKFPADVKHVSVSGHTEMSIATPLLNVPVTAANRYDFDHVSFGKPNPAGFGAAIDLGIHWDTPLKGLCIDAAVADLGFVRWGQSISGQTDLKNIVFDYTDKNTLLNDILGLDPKSATEKGMDMLSAKINAGIRYKMPFYKRLSVGAHGSFLLNDYYNSQDIRFGATLTPINAISLTANYGMTTFGNVIGVAANFRLGPIALFAGMDNLVTRISAQGIPLDPLNTTVKFGLCVAVK